MELDEIKAWIVERGLELAYRVDELIGIEAGRVNFYNRVVWKNTNLRGIPFKFGSVWFEFRLDNCEVDDLSFLPRKIEGDSERVLNLHRIKSSGVDLKPVDYARVLLVDASFIAMYGTDEQIAIQDILQDGRVDGVMPSELIPGKIAQLREMR